MNDRLTAMDVERQEFPARMLGYDKEDVRLFLRSVGEEIERLNFENGTLREEVGRLRETLQELRSRERMLQETLIAAQSLAAEIKDKSQKEAELLIKEARIKADRLLEQAQDHLEKIEAEIGRARLEREAFESRVRSCIEEHLALLELRRKERGQKDNVLVLRRRGGSEAG